jgi:hypothetical protein
MRTNFEPHTKNMVDDSISNVDGALSQLYSVKPVAVAYKGNTDVDAMDCGDDFSNIGGKRKACRAKGLKPNTKEFKECVGELKQSDKGKSRSEKKSIRKGRKSDFKAALAEGRTVDTKFQKVWNVTKKTNPVLVLMRGSTLLLIRLNVWDMAAKLSKLQELSKTNKDALKAWNNILGGWIMKGGSIKTFQKNVNIGKGKKPLIIRFKKKQKSGFDGQDEIYSNVVDPATDAAAAAATSTPVWIPIVTALGSTTVTALVGKLAIPKKDKEEAAKVASESRKSIPAISAEPSDEEKRFIQSEIEKNKTSEEDKILGMPKGVAYGLGALLVVGLIWGGYKLIKGKKVPVLTT